MIKCVMRPATRVVLVLSCALVGLAGCAKQTPPGFGTFVEMTPPPADDGGADSTTPLILMPPPVNDEASFAVNMGDSSGDAPPGTTVSLVFDPMSATVVIDGTGPQSASFTLKATDGNGNVQTVSPNSIQYDRPDLGSVTLASPVVATAPATASATPYGGTGTIHAIYDGLEAKATFTVQVHLTRYATGLSATSPGVIALNTPADGGTTLAADPAPGLATLLYPYDHTVWPLGLQTPLLMWNAPQAMDVYRLHCAEKNYTVDSFVTLAALPGQARLDQTIWDRLTNSNDTLHGGQDPIAFTLSRWDSVKQMAYASAAQTWTVAPESLRGAIYYWSASQTAVRVGHISRFQPGPGAAPEVLNNGVCMGCHAVNAQGTVLVADLDDQKGGAMYPSVAPYDNWSATRPWGAFDITRPDTPLIYQSNKFGADVALTPDGKYLVFGGPALPATPGSKYLSLGDPRTGMVVPTSGLDSIQLDPGETNLEMPAFSPDGKMLAVVESTSPPPQRDNVLPASPELISYLDFDQTGPTFKPTLHKIVDSASAAFAATGGGLAYPSFTPDSKAIAFHAGKTSTGCNPTGCDDKALDDGSLFIATVSGGMPIRLAAADDPPDPLDRNASVEPTFNPVVRGGYAWAVFTSMRKWGNQAWPAGLAAFPNCQGSPGTCNGKRRLWLTAVDTSIGTTDPSHPAIYLEGQEDTPNMRGFYTLAPCIPTFHGVPIDAGADDAQSSSSPGIMCANGFECCSGFCDTGVCIDVSKQSCVGLGGACTMTSDCCNAGVVKCLPAAAGGMVCAIDRPH